ncbi:hypothetical protein CYMTET_11352, partial [Cymbomonas tetramitiformis]
MQRLEPREIKKRLLAGHKQGPKEEGLGFGLTIDEIYAIANHMDYITVPRGFLLLEKGHCAKHIFFILKGKVELRSEGPKSTFLGCRGAGQFVGEEAFTMPCLHPLDGVRQTNFFASKESELGVFSFHSTQRLFKSCPTAGMKMCKRIAQTMVEELKDRLSKLQMVTDKQVVLTTRPPASHKSDDTKSVAAMLGEKLKAQPTSRMAFITQPWEAPQEEAAHRAPVHSQALGYKDYTKTDFTKVSIMATYNTIGGTEAVLQKSTSDYDEQYTYELLCLCQCFSKCFRGFSDTEVILLSK